MGPRLRRFALLIHLACSVGWIGAVLAYIALGVAAVTSVTDETVRAAWIAMEILGWFVLVPLALGSWSTGLVMALGTKWGLFRHYWVLFAFVFTTVAAAVLLMHMPDVSSIADVARSTDAEGLRDYGGDLVHAVLALVLLLLILSTNRAE